MVKRNKYGAVKTVINGIKFDSKAEAEYYLYLLEKIDSGADLELVELQPKVYLTDAKILMKPDFLIKENGVISYHEVKGFETAVYKIKRRLWKKYGPADLKVIKRERSGFVCKEIVYGRGVEKS